MPGTVGSLIKIVSRQATDGTSIVPRKLGDAFQASELKPTAASSKKQEENHNEQDNTESTAAIVANARTHVVPAAAEKQQKNQEN
jgi:hypothetical protein